MFFEQLLRNKRQYIIKLKQKWVSVDAQHSFQIALLTTDIQFNDREKSKYHIQDK